MTTILIVEDHADIRRLLRLTLELEDYVIHEADNAPSGLAAAQALRPDLVLLDVMMPGAFDGLTCCRLLRADATLAATRVVMLTARGHSQDREAGLAAGADAYLVKPFSPLQLIELVRRLIQTPRVVAPPAAQGAAGGGTTVPGPASAAQEAAC